MNTITEKQLNQLEKYYRLQEITHKYVNSKKGKAARAKASSKYYYKMKEMKQKKSLNGEI